MLTKKLLITDRRKVIEAYGKSEKEVGEYVEIVREWLKTQPHLPEVPSDHMIETFLTTNKFSVERTKQKLDMYYTLRTLIPELYQNNNPSLPHMQEAFNTYICCPLPKLTNELYRVHVVKMLCSAEVYDNYIMFTHLLNMIEVRIQEDAAVSDVFIFDYDCLTIGHIRKITLMHLKKVATVFEKIFSNRIKGLHIINYLPFADVLVNLVKMVLKPKLAKRIHIHSSIDGLLEYIPKEVLPKDYGGDEVSLKELNDLWKLKLVEYKDRFDTLDKLKVNEELRPEPLTNDDILGFHGNFKKIEVD